MNYHFLASILFLSLFIVHSSYSSLGDRFTYDSSQAGSFARMLIISPESNQVWPDEDEIPGPPPLTRQSGGYEEEQKEIEVEEEKKQDDLRIIPRVEVGSSLLNSFRSGSPVRVTIR